MQRTLALVAVVAIGASVALATSSVAPAIAWSGLGDVGGGPLTAAPETPAVDAGASVPVDDDPATPNGTATATPTATPTDGNPSANPAGENRIGAAGSPPDRATASERREAAFERAYANDTVVALKKGSFVVQPNYEYGPERDVVTLKTWHHKRVEGTWRTNVTVTYDEGYVVRLGVDPDADTITDIALSEREPAVVTKNYTAAEKDAIEIALANETVDASLEGADYYVAMVRDEVTYRSASCDQETCYLVVVKRTNGSAHLTAHVDAEAGRVVGVMDVHWNRPPGSRPVVNESAFPDVSQPVVPAPNRSVVTDDTPLKLDHWSVDYATTQDDGIRLKEVRYRGRTLLGPGTRLFDDVRVPHIHVKYDEEVEEYGGSGGHHHHTHIFDQLKTPRHGPHVHEFDDGFGIHARYYLGCEPTEWPTVGCYKYGQTWRFYGDGTFEPRLTIYGPGFMDSAGAPTYDTSMRFDSAVGPFQNDVVDVYGDGGWETVAREGNVPAGSPTADGGAKWRVRDPRTDAAADAEPYGPDGADFWVLRQVPPDDHHPENLDDDERTADRDLVEYYLSHRDACAPASPCRVGPTWDASELARLNRLSATACTALPLPAGVAETLSCRGGSAERA